MFFIFSRLLKKYGKLFFLQVFDNIRYIKVSILVLVTGIVRRDDLVFRSV